MMSSFPTAQRHVIMRTSLTRGPAESSRAVAEAGWKVGETLFMTVATQWQALEAWSWSRMLDYE